MTTPLLLRFDETDVTIRPDDAAGNLADLDVEAGLVMPAVVDAATGRGRSFASASTNGFRAQDTVPGTTLLTRDCSIQTIIAWNSAAAITYGGLGTIYARGKGTGAAEYVGAGLEVRVVNAALAIAELRWFWHDMGGTLKTQIGGHFINPATGYTLLTATRRWVSSTSVVLRYYIGDQLLSEIASGDGSIGGGTTGTTSIGARWTGAAWANFFDGVIDELRVVDYELTAEEIAATFQRITKWQPLGYKLLAELHPPGFPISADAHSRVQKETNLWGQSLGFAAAQAENVRANILPDRAYGPILSRWESIVAQPPKPSDSVDTRRARVVGRMRQRAGVSIPGLDAMLKDLVATDVSNLQFLAFPQELGDAMGTLYSNTLLWRAFAPAGAWTFPSAGSQAEWSGVNPSIAASPAMAWVRLEAPIPICSLYGDGQGLHLLSKVTPTTLPANAECGVYVGDWTHGDYFFFGIRNNAGTIQIVTEVFSAWVSGGVTVRATVAVAPTWFHLFHQGLPIGTAHGNTITPWLWSCAWSTTSEIAGYTTVANIAMPSGVSWCGLYARSFGAVVGTPDVTFDETRILSPFGDRSFFFYVFRDPALAGSADVIGSHNVIQGIRQAHTKGTIISTKTLVCNDSGSGCDRGPMGGF